VLVKMIAPRLSMIDETSIELLADHLVYVPSFSFTSVRHVVLLDTVHSGKRNFLRSGQGFQNENNGNDFILGCVEGRHILDTCVINQSGREEKALNCDTTAT